VPISPENRQRHKDNDWDRIRQLVRARAGDRCEGSPAYPDCRAANGQPHPVTGSKVILTCAHLNHVIEDMRLENLRMLCQRCHNTHDVAHRQATRRRRRAAQQWAKAMAPQQLGLLHAPQQLAMWDSPGAGKTV
jgi:hypothetical protein